MPDTAPMITVHDHTWAAWGHNLMLLDQQPDGCRSACIIQTPPPRPGDVVLALSNRRHADGSPGVLQYRIVGDVRTPLDPGDQHFVTLSFMERETNDADGRRPADVPLVAERRDPV